MAETTEFHAATVDEALEKAAGRLGVPREDISYEVLDSGSAGFMGIGARDARILVSHRSSAPESDVVSQVQAIFEEDTPAEETIRAGARDSHSEPAGETHESQVSAPPTDVAASEQVMAEAKEHLERLTDAMGLNCEIEVYDAGEIIAADVSCEETGLFIGHKGETIDAIQYLLNVAVYHDREYEKKIVVDCEGYRQRRIEAVQGIARRTARRTVREQRPMKLPPMNAAERRAVHMFLKDDPKVTTASEGRDHNRRVVVKPV
jgi:spoIIIJ-associated protein